MINRSKFFMIVGAPKCGTTTLTNLLGQVPNVVCSHPKEPTFWECDYPRGFTWYETTHFPFANLNDFCFDARVKHLCIPYIAPRVSETLGSDVPIFIVIRNPIDRFISDWLNYRNMRPGREPLGLADCVDKCLSEYDLNKFASEESVCGNRDVMGGPYTRSYLEIGMYDHWIKHWQKYFNNVNVILFDDLIEDQDQVVVEVMYNIDHTFHPTELRLTKVHSKKSLKGPLEFEDVRYARRMLNNMYKLPVFGLSHMLGKDLNAKWGIE